MRNHPATVIPGGGRDLLFNPHHLALLATALLIAFSLDAQEPVPLAHGNVPGEPHHHLKIENEYVRVYYVEAPPHESTLLHQHDHDYIYVSLGPSDVVNAILDKPEIHLQLKDGETHFTRGGFAHVARNLADTPFRNVTIELLKPQNEPRNICAQVAADAPQGRCPKWVTQPGEPMYSEPQFQTGELAMGIVHLDVNSKAVSTTPQMGTLVVMLSKSTIQIDVNGEPSRKLTQGDVLWITAGTTETIRNLDEKTVSYLQLSLAGSESLVRPH